MKRARLIYNPTSGREASKKNLAEILSCLEEMGYEASAFSTKGEGDATREACRASEDGFELIVAAGGDGTIYEVINGMAGKESRPRLAILPLGTTNDFARAIGIPRGIKKALEVIKKEATKKVDVGKMNEKYFINIAGGGKLTELTYEVPSKMKTMMGQSAYFIKGIEKLTYNKPFAAKIEANGEVIEEEILMFLVSNTNSVGGFEKLAPLADYSDGFLDVVILKKCNIAEFGIIVSHLLKGEHLHDSKIINFQTDQLTITTSTPVQMNLDGEFGGMSPCRFEVLKKHIEVIVNPNKLKKERLKEKK